MGSARRVIAILGAGGTLGTALSRKLAAEPETDLVLSDLSKDALSGVTADLAASAGTVAAVRADVSDFAQVEHVVKHAVDRFGRLDVLISNAGVLSPNGRIHNLAAAHGCEHLILFGLTVLRHDDANRPADDLACSVAEQSFRSPVPGHDGAIQILADNGVVA